MCLITMGLMAALASATVYVGLMVSKDGAGETPPEADARAPRRRNAALRHVRSLTSRKIFQDSAPRLPQINAVRGTDAGAH